MSDNFQFGLTLASLSNLVCYSFDLNCQDCLNNCTSPLIMRAITLYLLFFYSPMQYTKEPPLPLDWYTNIGDHVGDFTKHCETMAC